MTSRLKKIIHIVVSEDQSGFIKDRSAAECVRLVQDVIDYCQCGEKPGIVMFLDFKKGFDSVDHEFLMCLLRELNFKESFIRWVRTLYNNANGRILNYGWISEQFSIKRGVRQGCPLSALLFIIVAEVLAAKIKQNSKINGIYIPDCDNGSFKTKEISIVQYADDTTIFTDSVHSMKEIMKEVEAFGDNAGPKINWTKSNFMKVNINDIHVHDEHFHFTSDPVKCLGIFVGENTIDVQNLNWEKIVGKIKNTLDLWKMRRLTYYGKSVVINHLIMSQIVYTATAVPVPTKIIKDINKLVYKFLWNSRTEKVKRSTCQIPVTEGGLGVTDLHSKCQSLRLSWFQKYLKAGGSAWKVLFKYWTGKIGKIPLCLKFNCQKTDIYRICKKKNLPLFYLDLFCSWSELKHIDLFKVNDIENEIIWYNSNIKYGNEVLNFPSWIKSGIIKVGQVINNGVWKETESICSDFKRTKFLFSFKLAKLKKAFPNFWLQKLRNNAQCGHVSRSVEFNTVELVTGDVINAECTKARHYYKLFLSKNKQEPSFVYVWQAYFELPFDFDWKSVLKFKFCHVQDNRIKQFNFKFLHGILPSKDNLCKWRITNDNLCDICKTPETAGHFLVTCKKVSIFWKIISNIITHLFDVVFNIDERVLLLGYEIENRKRNHINLLLNFAQYVVYRNYVTENFEGNKRRMNAIYLLKELKAEMKFYFNLKFNQKGLNQGDMTKFCTSVYKLVYDN